MPSQQRPSLCIDARLLPAPGIGRALSSLIPRLAPHFRLSLLLDQTTPAPEGCTAIRLKSPIYSASEQLEMPRRIPPVDLFCSPHFNIPLLPIKARKRLVILQDLYHLAHSHELSFLQRVYAKTFYPAACKRADLLVTSSMFTSNELIRLGCPLPKRLAVIPYGVCEERFSHPTASTKQAAIDHLKLPKTFLLSLATQRRHKNQRRLLEAYARYRKRVESPLPLVLAGRIEEELELPEGVFQLGEVEERWISSLYSLATLFLFPSLYEGFGFPPLEAMRLGCPVMASARASLPEVCGDAAHFIDPLNIEGMAKAMARLIDSKEKRESLRAKGQKRALLFSWEECSARYRTLIEEVIDADRNRS